MRALKRVLAVLVAVAAAVGYVWVAAVRAIPGVRRRKAETRAGRRR